MVLTSPERRSITLFSQSALIFRLCLHFFEKLEYYTLGSKNYSTGLNIIFLKPGQIVR